ncbi:hypothetical protein ACFYPC_22800 [Streptomyces sp. NPDC005808]|uniref:hypothetical protein n=1 Tax=Streptomyces sp. NPDC005808 TaxID=3364734 RepID=UPI0036B34B99
MSLVFGMKEFEQSGIKLEQDWTWVEYFAHHLCPRQIGKVFFAEDGLGFEEAGPTERWTRWG